MLIPLIFSFQVFQKRVNGSVDFYRSFNEYENGFGSVYGEFWLGIYMSHLVGKQTMWFPNRSDTNRSVQSQKRARILKFRI